MTDREIIQIQAIAHAWGVWLFQGEDGPVVRSIRFPLVNLCQHATIIHTNTGILRIPPSGIIARAQETREIIGTMRAGVSVPLTRVTYGNITGLPDPELGIFYIVSRLVAAACPDREDLLIPDDTVRDEAGQIVGCRALARL